MNQARRSQWGLWKVCRFSIPYSPSEKPQTVPLDFGNPTYSHAVVGIAWDCATPSLSPLRQAKLPKPFHPGICPMSRWDRMGLPGMSQTIPHPEALTPTIHPIPMLHGDGMGLPPWSQLSITSRCPIGTGWDVSNYPNSRGFDLNCPSHPDEIQHIFTGVLAKHAPTRNSVSNLSLQWQGPNCLVNI